MSLQKPIEAPRLLYDRKQACALLGGVGADMLVQLEREGRLHPIRLTGGPNSKVFYNHDEIVALANGGGDG